MEKKWFDKNLAPLDLFSQEIMYVKSTLTILVKSVDYTTIIPLFYQSLLDNLLNTLDEQHVLICDVIEKLTISNEKKTGLMEAVIKPMKLAYKNIEKLYSSSSKKINIEKHRSSLTNIIKKIECIEQQYKEIYKLSH